MNVRHRVERLLFPVKLGPLLGRRICDAVLADGRERTRESARDPRRSRERRFGARVRLRVGPSSPIRVVVLAVASSLGVGCGYHAAYGNDANVPAFSVVAAPFTTPELEVVQSVLAGARGELSRAGALAPGSTYPELVVEVLRVDEVASGIRATPTTGGASPLAASSSVGVVVRGWVVEAPGASPTRDTGDVRCVETVAQGDDPSRSSYAAEEGERAAGRRAGEIVTRRALGFAEPSVEPM